MFKMLTAKKRTWLLLIPIVLSLSFLGIHGCGGGGYDSPSTTTTSSALISAETLKGWIDDGKVNSTGYERVVILDINTQANYNAGHIPGAYFVNSNDIYQNRKEGPAVDINMVLDGPHMDALIQKYGIDKNTTIVFTSGSGSCGSSTPGAVLNATRAYWTFRYWGFPKERLKVLDGINCDYGKKYALTTSSTLAAAPSTYSVRNIGILRSDIRASLAEMVDVADGKVPDAVVVDFRGPAGSYSGTAGSTSGVFNIDVNRDGKIDSADNDFVVFEGRIKGAKAFLWTDQLDPANNYRFLSADKLIAKFTAIGLDSTKIAHVY